MYLCLCPRVGGTAVVAAAAVITTAVVVINGHRHGFEVEMTAYWAFSANLTFTVNLPETIKCCHAKLMTTVSVNNARSDRSTTSRSART